MKTPSLIAAAFVATAIIGACSGTTPTGPQSTASSASLELSNSVGTQGVGGILSLDSASVVQLCVVELPTDSTVGEIGVKGTYAVAYGEKGCFGPP